MVLEEDGRQAFQDWLASSELSVANLVDSVVQRCHQVCASKESVPEGILLERTRKLIHVAKYLFLNKQGVGDRLLKERFIQLSVRALEKYSRDEHASGRFPFALIVPAIGVLVNIAEESGDSGWRQLASGTFITLVVRLLESLPPDDRSETIEIYRRSLLYFFGPTANRFLAQGVSLEGLPKKDKTKIPSRKNDPDLEAVWRVVDNMRNWWENAVLPCLNACDNPSVSLYLSVLCQVTIGEAGNIRSVLSSSHFHRLPSQRSARFALP